MSEQTSEPRTGPLSGVRIIESSMLGPAAITTALADLGADLVLGRDR